MIRNAEEVDRIINLSSLKQAPANNDFEPLEPIESASDHSLANGSVPCLVNGNAAGAQKQDVYKHWLFDPLFKEDGLVMDSETSLPDVYCYNLVCLPSRRRL